MGKNCVKVGHWSGRVDCVVYLLACLAMSGRPEKCILVASDFGGSSLRGRTGSPKLTKKSQQAIVSGLICRWWGWRSYP